MPYLKNMVRIGTGMGILTFFSFIAQPFTGILGLGPLAETSSIFETIQFSTYLLLSTLLIMIAVSFGLGYIILLGWTNRRIAPIPVRIGLAFVLGITAFIIGGPISIVVGIPVLPTIISTFALWLVLRLFSNFQETNSQKINIQQAMDKAIEFVKTISNNTESWKIQAVKQNGENWETQAQSENRVCTMNIDRSNGKVITWRID